MGSIKEINIKNRTYYFYNDIIDLKTFDSNNLKLDKKTYKNLDIYNIGYLQLKQLVTVMMLIVSIHYICVLTMRVDIYKKINKDKYLVFDVTDKNKNLLEKYYVFNGIMSKI